jgi:hypothetical protein
MQENNKNTKWVAISAILIILALGSISYYNRETLKKFFGFATAWNAFTYDTTGSLAVTNGWTTDLGSYAWSESSGWIDFAPVNGNIYVADNALWGYAYGENIGWISLNCGNTGTCGSVDYKVKNDGNGKLFGKAWGENIGWIDFGTTTANGGTYEVIIDGTSGDFSGYAYGENIGWISFNSLNGGDTSYKVSTNWQSLAVRTVSTKKTTRKTLVEQASSTNADNAKLITEDKDVGTSTEELKVASTTLITKVLTPINTVSLPVAEIKPLVLEVLPTFGGAGKNSFTFAPRIDSFLFSPLPDSILNYLDKNKALKDYLKSVGLNTTQNLISLIRSPMLMKSDSYLIPGIFTVSNGNSIVRTYLINDPIYSLSEEIRVASGTSLVISVLPIIKGEVIGTWSNGKTTNFILNDKNAVAKVTMSSVGKYVLKTPASPLPLVIDVIAPSMTENGQNTGPGGSGLWFSKLLGWFNK